jgi:hypothetical protein
MAAVLGVDRTLVSKYVSGARRCHDVTQLRRFAEAMDLLRRRSGSCPSPTARPPTGRPGEHLISSFAPTSARTTLQEPSQDTPLAADRYRRARHRLKDAETKLGRLRSAIEAGGDPDALIEGINQAQAKRAAAQAEVDNKPDQHLIDQSEDAR